MYPIPSTEKLVETKVCHHCQASFPITDKDLRLYDKLSPTFAWKKYSLPTPTLCPDCRQQRRLSFRNVGKIYKRKCDATGKDIISIYSPDKPFVVYNQDDWWSDKWDPMSYGRDFDFEKSFLEQFDALRSQVPRIALLNGFNENTEYANHAWYQKNCYLTMNAANNENCLFGDGIYYSNNTVESQQSHNCESCYEITDSDKCYRIYFAQNCTNCADSWFLYNCENCKFCFGCTNLTNKQYVIYNQQVSQEQFRKFIDTFSHSDSQLEEFKKKFDEILRSSPRRHLNLLNCENSIGNYLTDSKSCKGIYNGYDLENVAFCSELHDSKDCMDTDVFGEGMALTYEGHCIGGKSAHRILFSNIIWGEAGDVYYSDHCLTGCFNIFGCVGLHNKQYCILNKQYTKEEYEVLVPKIIEHMQKTGEWWEFFPSSLSPFGYNETVAQEYYPMTRDQILASPMRGGGTNAESTGGVWLEASAWSPLTPLHKGGESETFLHTLPRHPSDATPSFLKGNIFNWSDYEPPFPKVEKIIPASKLPQDIKDIPDDILNWAIECEVTKKPFRIIKQELEFYRKHNLPIPKRHPDQRHLDRMAQRNPRKLFERKCDCCKKGMITTYAPERPEKVYCEECYNKEVVG